MITYVSYCLLITRSPPQLWSQCPLWQRINPSNSCRAVEGTQRESPCLSKNQRKEQQGTQRQTTVLSQGQRNQSFRWTAKSLFYRKMSWTKLTRTRGTSNLPSRYSIISFRSTGFSTCHGFMYMYICMCLCETMHKYIFCCVRKHVQGEHMLCSHVQGLRVQRGVCIRQQIHVMFLTS